MYFAFREARRLSVVEVEQFRKARQVLGNVDLLGAWGDAGNAPCEPSEGGECALEAGRDCVRAELGHLVQPLVQVGVRTPFCKGVILLGTVICGLKANPPSQGVSGLKGRGLTKGAVGRERKICS